MSTRKMPKNAEKFKCIECNFICSKNSNYKIKQIRKPLYILNTSKNISSRFSERQKYFADCARKNINPK